MISPLNRDNLTIKISINDKVERRVIIFVCISVLVGSSAQID